MYVSPTPRLVFFSVLSWSSLTLLNQQLPPSEFAQPIQRIRNLHSNIHLSSYKKLCIFKIKLNCKSNQNMTTRTLFNIILKILGIFFIKDILATIPQLLSIILYLREPDVSGAVWTLTTTLLILLVYGLVSCYLIFKSNLIIDKLKLDKGFDQETIPLNIHRSTVLSISIIVIGGLLVADEIPNLCRQLFNYFLEKRTTYGQTHPSISYSVLSAAKIVIGLLLIGNQRQIVNFIEYKRKK